MSCTCQVKDRDPEKPCPVCGDDPQRAKADERRTDERIDTLAKMMRPRMRPREEPR